MMMRPASQAPSCPSIAISVKSDSRMSSRGFWPEVPAPFYPSDRAFHEYIAQVARAGKTHFLFGGVAYTPKHAPLNSAFLVDPSGEIVERYDKIKLVPFGDSHSHVTAYLDRLQARPSFARVIKEAEPYFGMFP